MGCGSTVVSWVEFKFLDAADGEKVTVTAGELRDLFFRTVRAVEDGTERHCEPFWFINEAKVDAVPADEVDKASIANIEDGCAVLHTAVGDIVAKADGELLLVDLNKPDGTSGQIGWFEAGRKEDGFYPTEIRAFTFDGNDTDITYRTDIDPDGDEMQYEPRFGVAVHVDKAATPSDSAKAAKKAAGKSDVKDGKLFQGPKL